jgi:hypothetical protein
LSFLVAGFILTVRRSATGFSSSGSSTTKSASHLGQVMVLPGVNPADDLSPAPHSGQVIRRRGTVGLRDGMGAE